ncbi:MAG TPA: Holliday junction resolvase RuvX [Patescibacteria group bacterium]|nr:Holliday junction resolvase RuvX [Patescibacteria group bacterium]
MRYLGIDYGKRWIGLAIADTRVNVVIPMEVIENKGEEKLFSRLSDLIKGEKIDELVIGVPYSLNSQKSAQTKETLDFVKKLSECVKIPVHEEDERLTSQGAAKLAVNGFGKETRMHSNAAALILDSFIARQNKG